jgi:flagellar hook-associated protein 2
MATISSLGVGSGLDVNSIVSKLVDVEKHPLQALAVKATNVQSQISAFGTVQSEFAALTDVATRLADPTAWAARTTTSSNASAATITATGSAVAANFSLDVDQLAQKQIATSAALAADTKPGAGTLTFQVGTWSGSGTSFVAGTAASVDVVISATDTLSNIASKINSANTGVVASVFNDGTNQRLLLQSKSTGEASGFRVQSADVALSGLVFDPQNSSGTGMAATGLPVQYAQDAKARINGLAVTSTTNTLKDYLPGVTISLLATTTVGYDPQQPTGSTTETRSPLTMGISEDVTIAVKNVNDFVTAYNTLNKSLAALTSYDSTTNTAGLFQGDSSVKSLQSVLRNMLGSTSLGSSLQHLSDIGVERQLDGSLTINTTKLSAAANDGDSLQQLFTNDNNDASTNGFALKFRDLGKGIAATDGSLSNKAAVLKKALDSNTAAQAKINTQAALFETRLKARYSALDTQMASLTALSSYVSQQVTQWNKSSS